MTNRLTSASIKKSEKYLKNTEICTCTDRPVYVAGIHLITKATTDRENCKRCNRKNIKKENSHEQN